MNSKILNLVGIVTVFIGLFSLMSLHVSHHLLENRDIPSLKSEESLEDSASLTEYYHILFGFPVSVLGAMLLILAEKQEKRK